jgi:hypothetical protein
MLIQPTKIRHVENLIRLLESLTNIRNSRNSGRITVGYTRNYTKMRERSRKLEKGIAFLLGDYKPIHVTSSNTQSSKLILKAIKPVLKALLCLDSMLWFNQMGKKGKINYKICKGRFEFRRAC